VITVVVVQATLRCQSIALGQGQYATITSATNMASSFVYEPLAGKIQQLRLLEVLSAKPNETMTFRVIRAALNDAPPYDALSYTWNDPFSTQNNELEQGQVTGLPSIRIIVNDGYLEVSEHLHDALRFIAPFTSRLLWIDAICINQADLAERAEQVGIMGRIFSHAERVLAWLGPSSADSDLAINFLEMLAEHATRADRVAWLVSLAQDPACLPQWVAFHALITRGWWKRSWVIQEYVLGREVVFACGGRQLAGDQMDAASQLLFDGWAACFATGTMQRVGLNARVMDPMWNLFELRHRLKQQGQAKSGKHIGPLTYLSRTRQSRASDPRDRLFAKFGMIGDQANTLCTPNYALPPTHIYRTFFAAYVAETEDLYIVCHAGLGFNPEAPSKPTWLPTWSPSKHPYALRCCWSGGKSDWPMYNAAGGSKPAIRIDVGEGILSTQALLFDEVDGIQWEPWWCGENVVKQGFQTESDECAYESTEEAFHALRRTLVADTNRRVGRQAFPMFEPAKAPAVFGALFAHASQEYDRLMESLGWPRGEMPTMHREGANNIEKRWCGMRNLKLGKMLLRDITSQAIEKGWARKDVPHDTYEAFSNTPFNKLPDWLSFEHSHGQATYRRRIFTTRKGYLGLASRALHRGDHICILRGCPVPVLLRRHGAQYQVVGEAYVDGIMYGEITSEGKAEWANLEIC
jgi:hypothetical protein